MDQIIKRVNGPKLSSSLESETASFWYSHEYFFHNAAQLLNVQRILNLSLDKQVKIE